MSCSKLLSPLHQIMQRCVRYFWSISSAGVGRFPPSDVIGVPLSVPLTLVIHLNCSVQNTRILGLVNKLAWAWAWAERQSYIFSKRFFSFLSSTVRDSCWHNLRRILNALHAGPVRSVRTRRRCPEDNQPAHVSTHTNQLRRNRRRIRTGQHVYIPILIECQNTFFS